MHKTGLEKRRISCSCKVHALAQSLFPSCTPPFYGVYSHFITIPYSLSYVRDNGNENWYYKQVRNGFYWCSYITNRHNSVQNARQPTKQHGSPWLCSIKLLNHSHVPWNTLTHPHWQLTHIKSVWLFVYYTSHTYRNYCENIKGTLTSQCPCQSEIKEMNVLN